MAGVSGVSALPKKRFICCFLMNSSAVFSPLRKLQRLQQATRFVGESVPPRLRGVAWSHVVAPGLPQ
jgi:hypothetical protein